MAAEGHGEDTSVEKKGAQEAAEDEKAVEGGSDYSFESEGSGSHNGDSGEESEESGAWRAWNHGEGRGQSPASSVAEEGSLSRSRGGSAQGEAARGAGLSRPGARLPRPPTAERARTAGAAGAKARAPMPAGGGRLSARDSGSPEEELLLAQLHAATAAPPESHRGALRDVWDKAGLDAAEEALFVHAISAPGAYSLAAV